MARDAFDDLADTEQEEYDTAIAHLQNNFVTKNTKKQAKLLLKTCTQQSGEPIPAFASRVRQLVQGAAADMPEETKAELMLDSFVENLEPALSYQVQMKFPHSFEAAFEIALHIQDFKKSQEPTSSFVHATTKTSKRSDLENRIDRLEIMLQQLVNNQLQQYQYQNQYDGDWNGANEQPQYQLWNNEPDEYNGEHEDQ